MFKRFWPCIGVAIIICVIVIYLPCRFEWWCWPLRCQDCPDCPPAAAAQLVVEHEDLIAFAQLNNAFSGEIGDAETGSAPCTDGLQNYWSGLLFQLGDYQDDCQSYRGVRLTLAEGDPVDLPRTAFDWINIVSKHAANYRSGCDGSFGDCYRPMLPEEVVKLFPSTVHADGDGCCWATEACKEGAPLHNRMITIPNIITYWEGSNGYDMRARYDAAPKNTHNSYEFVFHDEFVVYVYDLAPAEDGSCGVTQIGGSPYENVVEITILGSDEGPGSGVRLDPPIP